MSGPNRSTFPRSLRLESSSDFRRLKEDGRREVCGCLVMNWSPATSTRLGVVTSRKVGPAVGRSRARRWMREAFRIHRHEMSASVEIVLVARPSISRVGFAGVERDLLTLLSRARLRPIAAPRPS